LLKNKLAAEQAIVAVVVVPIIRGLAEPHPNPTIDVPANGVHAPADAKFSVWYGAITITSPFLAVVFVIAYATVPKALEKLEPSLELEPVAELTK
jgi:hypothetical protein